MQNELFYLSRGDYLPIYELTTSYWVDRFLRLPGILLSLTSQPVTVAIRLPGVQHRNWQSERVGTASAWFIPPT